MQSTTPTGRGYVSKKTPSTLVRWHPSPYAWNRLERMCPQTQETPISSTQASPGAETRTAIHWQKQTRTGTGFSMYWLADTTRPPHRRFRTECSSVNRGESATRLHARCTSAGWTDQWETYKSARLTSSCLLDRKNLQPFGAYRAARLT